jgi:hypothetical protein
VGAAEETSDHMASSASGPEEGGGLKSMNVWLHGPYETAGIPFTLAPIFERIARTRQRTTDVQAGS